jgi:nucleoside phosphorylase
MPTGGEIAVVTALPEELAPLLSRALGARRIAGPGVRAYTASLGGRAVVLAATGDGPLHAERGLRALLTRPRISGFIGAGLAGALSPDVSAGTILVAESLVRSGPHENGAPSLPDARWTQRALALGGRPASFQTVATIAATAAEKEALRAGCSAAPGVLAVDMESQAWLRAAEETGTPGILVRVVSDSLEEEIPAFVALAKAADGSVDRRRIVLHALRHPSAVGKLLAMRRRVRFCSERLADYIERLLASERPGS